MVEATSFNRATSNPEAEKAFKKGKKAITTSLFKWSADYLEGSLQFEKAGKGFTMSGMNDRAYEAWIEYSNCCEKNNEMTGAAEGCQEAAFVCDDIDKSVSLIKKADGYYRIGGYNDRGLTLMKRFAKQLLEKETEAATQKAMLIYENELMTQVFEGDNYLLNTDIPESYLRLQIEAKDYAGAIRTKKKFIEYLRNEGTTDHQIRRSWLEVICLQILMEDFYRLEDSLQSFANEPGHGNMYGQDEFTAANDLKDAISAKDFPKMT